MKKVFSKEKASAAPNPNVETPASITAEELGRLMLNMRTMLMSADVSPPTTPEAWIDPSPLDTKVVDADTPSCGVSLANLKGYMSLYEKYEAMRKERGTYSGKDD